MIAEQQLLSPDRCRLVLCRSRGGPFDDEAFMSGWRLGEIGATLGRPGISCVWPSRSDRDERLQADLIAMARGFTMTGRVRAAAGDWLSVTFTRIREDGSSSRPVRSRRGSMRILLLCSAFNGLSQRAWLALRDAGHEVSVELATSAEAMVSAVALFEPDLIICPFLRERVPEAVWSRYRTIIVHPGPKGDRGPSSLDWALLTGAPRVGGHRVAGGGGDGCRPDLGHPQLPAARSTGGRARSTTVRSPTPRSS